MFAQQTRKLVQLRRDYGVALARLERRVIDAYESPSVNVLDVILAADEHELHAQRHRAVRAPGPAGYSACGPGCGHARYASRAPGSASADRIGHRFRLLHHLRAASNIPARHRSRMLTSVSTRAARRRGCQQFVPDLVADRGADDGLHAAGVDVRRERLAPLRLTPSGSPSTTRGPAFSTRSPQVRSPRSRHTPRRRSPVPARRTPKCVIADRSSATPSLQRAADAMEVEPGDAIHHERDRCIRLSSGAIPAATWGAPAPSL